jgi:hypothetical protein
MSNYTEHNITNHNEIKDNNIFISYIFVGLIASSIILKMSGECYFHIKKCINRNCRRYLEEITLDTNYMQDYYEDDYVIENIEEVVENNIDNDIILNNIILNNKNTITCPICIEEMKVGDKISKIKICSHIFHKDCIKPWIEKNFTCPLCRVKCI